MFLQNYNPLGNAFLSTLVAALPLITLLYLLAVHPWRDQGGNPRRGIEAPKAAAIASLLAFAVAIFVLRMPATAAVASFVYGSATGLFPIGWILLSAMFLYTLTVVTGQFDVVKESITRVSSDRRIQVLIIAFSLGAFLEGAAGFGIPVAIAGALMVGLGFSPFQAAVLNLLANPVPVAFGGIGTPIITLGKVTGLDDNVLAALTGKELALFCLIIPTWVIAVMVKMDGKPWQKVWEVWPALLTAGLSFTLTQLFVSAYMGPSLVGILSGLVSMAALVVLSLVWRPAAPYEEAPEPEPLIINGRKMIPMAGGSAAVLTGDFAREAPRYTTGQVFHAWMPWILLTVLVFVWGQPSIKPALLQPIFGLPTLVKIPIPFLHHVVVRMPPVATGTRTGESALFTFDWLSTPGTGLFLAAVLSGIWLRATGAQWREAASRTLTRMQRPLITVGTVLGFSYLTRYAGTDGILGLAFTRTGWLYPFFAPLLGWLGVFITGSDTSANAMFGSLQQITARQLGLNEVLITTANTSGGVMAKMIGAQSLVIATAATYEKEEEGKAAVGQIFRAMVGHSLVLSLMMGIVIMLMAYVFTGLLPK
ncbi:MAG TPA: lactate permease LctP family transporter [Symbiobacteriaceae bacterium]|nr:lactate permease LctP family transporter [Symbiobacteriaceae bacterium]